MTQRSSVLLEPLVIPPVYVNRPLSAMGWWGVKFAIASQASCSQTTLLGLQRATAVPAVAPRAQRLYVGVNVEPCPQWKHGLELEAISVSIKND